MDRNHDILLGLYPGVLPEEINGVVIPSMYHCAGTDKLIGQYYGKAIFEDILCDDKQLEEKISLLGVILRAYIVVDDFIKDNNITVKNDHVLQKWLENMQNYSIDLIGQLNDSPRTIWDSYFHEYGNAYYNFDSFDIFNNIIKKCFLIFIPFSLEIISSYRRSEYTYDFMKNYLFALQLLDDFQDMEEDNIAPKNHNIFLSCIDSSQINIVIANKIQVAPSLLFFIKKNLMKYTKTIESKTILTFIKKNIKWIENQLSKFDSDHHRIAIKGDFSEFNFKNLMPNFLDAIPRIEVNKFMSCSEIRAENMHTVTAI